MSKRFDGFVCYDLDDIHKFHVGRLPLDRILESAGFESAWGLHPDEYHTIMMRGRPVKTPRWQQAYGKDYNYTGQVNKALPIPPQLATLLDWCQTTIDARLNGLLLNWYDGRLGHYIGKHRDSRKNMVEGAPIVTISFGEERVFRLSPWKGNGIRDFRATHGGVFIMPYETNLAWTHEVPKSSNRTGRRISVTLRAFSK